MLTTASVAPIIAVLAMDLIGRPMVHKMKLMRDSMLARDSFIGRLARDSWIGKLGRDSWIGRHSIGKGSGKRKLRSGEDDECVHFAVVHDVHLIWFGRFVCF